MTVSTQHPPSSPAPSRRWRTYSVTGILGLGALAGQCAAPQCAPAPPAPAPAPAAGAIQQVLDLTNQRRAENGLPGLVLNQALVNAAQGHSDDQAARATMSHSGSDGSSAGQRIERQGYRWSAWAENVAMGYPDAASVMDGWMGSSGHRANILGRNVTEIGIGLAHAADGSPYWTQVFARPWLSAGRAQHRRTPRPRR